MIIELVSVFCIIVLRNQLYLMYKRKKRNEKDVDRTLMEPSVSTYLCARTRSKKPC